ncbi:hypothetical protein [Streptomyces sp. NPDC048508]|uniref:hypothetical protein n=1 Tax=Streptomyces sp. NPDC048508 TaxID=3365561 RepID=UPI003711A594
MFGSAIAEADEALLGELLVARLRDAMLGLAIATPAPLSEALTTDFNRALADFDACRYASLALRTLEAFAAGAGTHRTRTGKAPALIQQQRLPLLARRPFPAGPVGLLLAGEWVCQLRRSVCIDAPASGSTVT